MWGFATWKHRGRYEIILECCKKGLPVSKQQNLNELVAYKAPLGPITQTTKGTQNLFVWKCSMSPRETDFAFFYSYLFPWWFFQVATAAYNVFGTWDNLCFLFFSRCKTHKGYPFNAEYWRWFPAFLQTSQICLCCCLWVVYVAFPLPQTPLHTPIFFFFSPHEDAIYVLCDFVLFSFFGRRKYWKGSEEHTVWTSRFSLPNSKSGIGKQKALSKFEQAVTFILEYCELELWLLLSGRTRILADVT